MISAEGSEAALRYSVSMPGKPVDIFDRFTALDAWWPRHHKVGRSAIATLAVAPHMSGLIKEIGVDGVQTAWGHVIGFERPERFAFRWTCDMFWRGSETSVAFVPTGGDQVRIELAHGRLAAMAGSIDDLHASFGAPTGWRDILGTFVNSAGAPA